MHLMSIIDNVMQVQTQGPLIDRKGARSMYIGGGLGLVLLVVLVVMVLR